jgi:hypothetical protein
MFDEWSVFTDRNLIGRDNNKSHRSFRITSTRSDEKWVTTEWRDGGTVNR